MKNKIAKILGAVLTVVTLASLFVFAGPVNAAAPDQAWNTIPTPGTAGFVLPNDITLTGPVIKAPADLTGNTLFAFIKEGNTTTSTWSIIRSVNFGRTWTSIATIQNATTLTSQLPVVAMVSADSDANTLYYATATTVYKSVNALATTVTWNPQANIPAGQTIISMDAMLYGGRYLVAVGTSGAPGNVYWMDESIPFFSFVTLGTSDFATAVGQNVTSVIAVYFSPNFATDRVIFAVGVQSTGLNPTTVLAVNVAGGDWTGAMATAKFNAANSPPLAPVTNTTIAQIFFPTDYNFTTAPRFYLAVNGADSGLYWWIGNVVASTLVPVPGVMPGLTGTMFSLDGVGSFSTASLMVGTSNGQVFTSVNGGAVWYAPTKPPTGAPRPMIVIMKVDFLTSHNALAIATGVSALDQSGVSLTIDSGVTFNQISLLDDTLGTGATFNALALGTAYTFAAGSRLVSGSSLVAGGSFTVNTGVNTLDSFKIQATNTGDQIQLTALVGAPVAQQVTITGGALNVDFNVTLGGGAYQIGNTFFLPSPGGFINLMALHNGASTYQLQVNGSGVSGFPFRFLAVSVPYDPNTNVTYSEISHATDDIGFLNFVLPNGTADVATVTQSSLPNGALVPTIVESGTKPTTNVLVGATYTITFGDPGDYVLFTAGGTATNTGSWAITTGAPFSAIVTNGGGATVSNPGPGAYNLPNFTAVYSVVTLTGAGIDNPLVTYSAPGAYGVVYTAGVSRVFTFTGAGGTVTVTNTALTPQNITATHTSGTTESYTGLSNLTGSLPGPVVLGAQVAAVSPTYVNFVWRVDNTTLTNAIPNWERVYYAAGQPYALNLAQLSATGNALYIASIGDTWVYKSVDNGYTWTRLLFATPTAIASLLAIDPTTVLVGSNNNVYTSTFNGFWTSATMPTTSPLGNITSLAVSSSNSAYIVAGADNGKYAISANSGALFGSTSNTGTGAATPVYVSFEFGSTVNVYADAAGVAGVFRNGTNVDINANILDSSANSLISSGAGVAYGNATSPATVEYAIDALDGYVARITNSAGSTYTAGNLAVAAGSARGMWVLPALGKNSIWGIFGTTTIQNYVDYLAVSVTGVTASPVTPNSVTVSWTAVPVGTFAATSVLYEAAITTGSTALKNPYTSQPIVLPAATYQGAALTTTFTGLANYTTYTVSVWVYAPVVSFYGSVTFTTQLSAPIPIAPSAGAAFVPVNPSFAWSSIPSATGYELWISQSDPTFAVANTTVKTVPVSGNPMSALNWTGAPLANNTTYYWEVRATIGSVSSPWSSIYGFTTVTAQLPAVTVPPAQTVILTQTSNPVPTIIISYPPVVTVTQAASNPAPVLTVTQPVYTIAAAETSTPTYIWIIVGIGALLTLAVIILIIRTRRVV